MGDRAGSSPVTRSRAGEKWKTGLEPFQAPVTRSRAGDSCLLYTSAASLLLLTPWRPDRILVDPFCGSGTFPIEAAMIAAGMAPGMNREFTAEQWTNQIDRKPVSYTHL